MGTLRSSTDHSGNEFNGITLGVPAAYLNGEPCPVGQVPDEYLWDDSRLPTGTIDADGNLVVDSLPGEVIVKGATKPSLTLKWSSLEAVSRAESFGIATDAIGPGTELS